MLIRAIGLASPGNSQELYRQAAGRGTNDLMDIRDTLSLIKKD